MKIITPRLTLERFHISIAFKVYNLKFIVNTLFRKIDDLMYAYIYIAEKGTITVYVRLKRKSLVLF